MISELKDPTERTKKPIFVAEFGLIDARYIDIAKKYQGRLYRLNTDASKAVSEAVGFTAHFDLVSMKTAYMDIAGTEGLFVLEIERNTKPADIGVRYARDRWNVSEVYGKGPDGLRPWIRTDYHARFLPDKILSVVAEQIKIKFEYLDKFFVRINFKDKTLGLIVEEKYAEHLPVSAFANFSLPTEGIGSIEIKEDIQSPTMIMAEETKKPMSENFSQVKTTNESQVKYATYSCSEVDQLLKQQAEAITSALGGKISTQQRIFLEAVANQEKSFNKLTENITAQLEFACNKLENTVKDSNQGTKSELDEFKKQLNKELEQYRSSINKSIAPVARMLEEKPLPKQQAQAKSKESSTNVENTTALLNWLRACLFAVIVSAAIICVIVVKFSGISDVNTRLDAVSGKVDELVNKTTAK